MEALLEILEPDAPERALVQSLDPGRLPCHIAIIMDGNGRWANRRSLPRPAGHEAGVEPARTVIETCARLGIRYLTLYAFSLENWKRPRAEVDMLWRLLQVYIRRELPNLMKHGVRVKAIGRIDALPDPARRELVHAVEATAQNQGLQVNLAINYGGRAELADAFNAILDKARAAGTLENLRVTEQDIAGCLYTAGVPDPDLLIRTSGEMRISNFLLWQIAYAELFVTDTLWPDFTRADLLRAILEYQSRDRRFGGLAAAGAKAR
ncbi:MAG TPA: isoprenyl transferase [Bryobacteraceae bacterium]|nr:isoprenyl transferase [Bryobacteraceae bacterium]HOQ45169.1 isoprenyl transferase [Bryobacteraceae bacterium]HPQ16677.1 isoprenyl transferase [Bryobacteraceae bacterium]HPU71241.1 isoprenyl transferase [Bryobacteraceae bacterium]